MIDLTTRYLGLTLRNPLVASSSPLCEDLDKLMLMEDNGVAAVVLQSLFEEQIDLHRKELFDRLSPVESHAEAINYFPNMGKYNFGPDGYLEHIRKAKQSLAIPVIASLNGVTPGGWLDYASLIEEAGADALELNIYHIPTDPAIPGYEVEQMYLQTITLVTSRLKIPVAVKIGSQFSSIPHMACSMDQAGAKGLVLFNRFYQPDLNIEDLEVVPSLTLSNSHDLLLRLNWVAILYGMIRADLAITGGVHTAKDVLKSMMAGARVTMLTSALLKYGIEHLRSIIRDLEIWMDVHEYSSIKQMQGSLCRISVMDSNAYERANYMRVLSAYIPRQY